MSFREKIAWACLGTTIAVFVPYFAFVFRVFGREQFDAAPVLGAFVGAVVFQIVLLVAASICIAITTKEERKDERDLAIESKSFRIAYSVLSVSAFLGVGGVVFVTVTPTPKSPDHLLVPVLMSQIFLLCFVVAEATKYLTQAVSYRRGS